MAIEVVYPHEYDDLGVSTLADPQVKGYIEGYAAALTDLMLLWQRMKKRLE
jgi:hypothetical protein